MIIFCYGDELALGDVLVSHDGFAEGAHAGGGILCAVEAFIVHAGIRTVTADGGAVGGVCFGEGLY